MHNIDCNNKKNMEIYTFAGTLARRDRIVDGQTFQINKIQASLRQVISALTLYM
jgi:hypothetical protein